MCRRLDEVLKAVSVKKIDLWVLDVEGAEIEVLLSFDWKSVPVHVLIIERNHKDHDVEALLFRQGFEYVREQRGNRVWVNPKYLDL